MNLVFLDVVFTSSILPPIPFVFHIWILMLAVFTSDLSIDDPISLRSYHEPDEDVDCICRGYCLVKSGLQVDHGAYLLREIDPQA